MIDAILQVNKNEYFLNHFTVKQPSLNKIVLKKKRRKNIYGRIHSLISKDKEKSFFIIYFIIYHHYLRYFINILSGKIDYIFTFVEKFISVILLYFQINLSKYFDFHIHLFKYNVLQIFCKSCNINLIN